MKNREKAANEKIKENYNGYSMTGYIQMATEKAVITWGDGKFDADVFLCTPYRENFMHKIILKGQLLYKPYTYYTQRYYMMVLFLICISLFRQIRGKGIRNLEVIVISLFGIMLFFNFWETTSRYIVNILPLMILVAAEPILHEER